MSRFVVGAVLASCVLVLAAGVFVNVVSISDAFGEGPPFYGRTTNMDKWRNPLPALAAIDGVILVVVFLAVRWIRRPLREGK